MNESSVSRQRNEWPCKTKQQLLIAPEQVARAVKEVGEPWLIALLGPKILAEQADPVAALVAGFAWERAGEAEKAKERYRNMLGRLDEINRRYPQLKATESHMKQYLFLAARLGFENDYSAKYRLAMGLAIKSVDT